VEAHAPSGVCCGFWQPVESLKQREAHIEEKLMTHLVESPQALRTLFVVRFQNVSNQRGA
jgi:hypothetical protein